MPADPDTSSEPRWSRWQPFGRFGPLPTTAQGAEMAVVIFVLGIRLGTLIQMAPALPHGIEISPRPGWYVVSFVVGATAAVAISLDAVRRRRPAGAWVVAVDVAIAVSLLVLGHMVVPTDHRLGTWEGFQPGYALSVLLSSCFVRSRTLWLVTIGAVIAGHLVYVGGGDEPSAVSASTTVGNALSYVVLTFVTRLAVSYVRRISADADRARARASELARREAERLAQATFHNGVTVMRLLSDPGLDPATRALLQEQGKIEARRMRSYLRGERTDVRSDTASPTSLARAVAETCSQFGDLAIEHALDLTADVELSVADTAAIQRAMDSILNNIRLHADAHQVVVHLDAEGPADGWTLTIHDDGRGFDAAPANYGVGLRELVVAQLDSRQIEATIESHLGVGTTVTLTRPATPSTSAQP